MKRYIMECLGNGNENGEVKQETVSFGYDNSYSNYSLSSLSSSTINQPLPGQPPLPPMPPPPPGTIPPPPPHVYDPLRIAQVTPLQTWTRPPPPWQWMTPHASPLPPQSTRDMAANNFQREIPLRGNYIGRDRFNHNRNSTYIQRSNFHRKNRRQPRFDQTHGQFDQTTYFGPIMPSGVSLDWQRNTFSTPSTDTLANHIPVQTVRPTRITTGRHGEESSDQDIRTVTENVVMKKLKQRKPMSLCYPSRPWNHEAAEKALQIENEYNKTVKAQSLIIKFPDPDLNKDIVKEFHSGIQNIHFQSPSGPRYCFIQMAENVDIDEAIKELEKIPFSVGHLKVERKSLRDEDNPVPEEIDPYTLYIGNLPESVNVNEVKSKFPTALRVDVGYAQKMRNTRYAFVRYNSVDESISAYKQAHNLMWDTRSIIVRFRRQRGNTCLPGEPKSNVKKVKENQTIITQVKNQQQANGNQQEQFKQESSGQNYNQVQVDDNNVKSKTSGQTQPQINVNLTSTSPSSSILPTSVAPAKLVQQQQPWTSQPPQIPSESEAPPPPPCSMENDLTEEPVMLAEIKEEPEDYDEMEISDDMQMEDVDDDDDDDDDDDNDDTIEDYEDDSDDNDADDDKEIEEDDEEDETDDSIIVVGNDKPKLACKDVEPIDHLDKMFNDLENAADGIGF